ncbi:MAG TPA: hypothetical protein VEJ18_11455 [Planctomycetota bacterium]|nr:hypothetical protein [Planctomycetota bacterium]
MAFCHITTHVEGEKHADLLQEKGGQGFPHIVFMDADGNVLAEHAGPRTADGFAKTGEAARTFVALREKAAKGDPTAKADLLVQQVKMGHVTADAAEKQAAELTLTPEQKTALEGAVADARVMEIARGVRSNEQAKEAGKKFLAMHKAGKAGPSSEEAAQPYWIMLMMAAEETKDVEAFETGLKTLKAKFGDNPRAQAFFKKQEETLKELKGEKK